MKTMLKSTLTVSLVIIMSACGGGGGSGGVELSEPIGDISGRWTVVDTVVSADGICSGNVGEVIQTFPEITQSGNDITISFINQVGTTSVFTGTLSGNSLIFEGSQPENGGTINSVSDITVSSDCNSLSGQADWTWSGGGVSCNGVSNISGLRDNPVGCGG